MNSIAAGPTYGIALIGLVGVVLGSLFTSLATILKDWLQRRAEIKRDEPRRKLLEKMLEDDRVAPDHWRNFTTLMHVIGSDEETTKRLLLEIDARASEDGQPKWTLMKYHPLGKVPYP